MVTDEGACKNVVRPHVVGAGDSKDEDDGYNNGDDKADSKYG